MGRYRHWKCKHCKRILPELRCYKPKESCICGAFYWVAISNPDVEFRSSLIEIHEWQRKTFPDATAETKYAHLQKEIKELGENLTDRSEIADCLLLLVGIAMIQGYDPLDIMLEKFDINKARNWGPPDENGVREHVE